MSVPITDDLTTWQYATSPERGLLAAVLERSMRDLAENVLPQHTREALRWFRANGNSGKYVCSFKRVVEELELSAWQLDMIRAKVAEAESRTHGRH